MPQIYKGQRHQFSLKVSVHFWKMIRQAAHDAGQTVTDYILEAVRRRISEEG